MKGTTEIDRQARGLLKALKRTLIHHFGEDSVDPGFLTDLYWRLRESLVDLREAEDVADTAPSSYCERLAMDIYLTAVTHIMENAVTAAFLNDVKQNIAELLILDPTLSGSADPSVPPTAE